MSSKKKRNGLRDQLARALKGKGRTLREGKRIEVDRALAKKRNAASLSFVPETNYGVNPPVWIQLGPAGLELSAPSAPGFRAIPWSFTFGHDCGGAVAADNVLEDRLLGVPCSGCSATFTVERVWDSPFHAHGEVSR